jgi:hypothetical protein
MILTAMERTSVDSAVWLLLREAAPNLYPFGRYGRVKQTPTRQA